VEPRFALLCVSLSVSLRCSADVKAAKRLNALILEIDCDQAAMGLPPVRSAGYSHNNLGKCGQRAEA
jgi:hypothetical protein